MKKQDIDIDIIKILKEIAHNEHEKFKTFKHRLVEYCTINEGAVFGVLRVLRDMEQELNEYLGGHVHINVNRMIIIKVLTHWW